MATYFRAQPDWDLMCLPGGPAAHGYDYAVWPSVLRFWITGADRIQGSAPHNPRVSPPQSARWERQTPTFTCTRRRPTVRQRAQRACQCAVACMMSCDVAHRSRSSGLAARGARSGQRRRERAAATPRHTYVHRRQGPGAIGRSAWPSRGCHYQRTQRQLHDRCGPGGVVCARPWRRQVRGHLQRGCPVPRTAPRCSGPSASTRPSSPPTYRPYSHRVRHCCATLHDARPPARKSCAGLPTRLAVSGSVEGSLRAWHSDSGITCRTMEGESVRAVCAQLLVRTRGCRAEQATLATSTWPASSPAARLCSAAAPTRASTSGFSTSRCRQPCRSCARECS
jgi:hypothetical protein